MHRPIAVLAFVLVACGSEEPLIDQPDATDVFIGEEHACFDCDDRDFCTDDLCQDNACVHVPRDAFNACLTDNHCEDGDSCTINECVLDECNLKRCRSRPTFPDNSCRSCDFSPCDDGNPCTVDTCGADKLCTVSAPIEGCDPNCSVFAAFSTYNANQFAYGSFIGIAQTRQVCEGDGCTCDNPIALNDGSAPLDLESGDQDDPWACTVDVCGGARPSCSPLLNQVGYIVWGEVRYLAQRFVPPDPSFDASGAPQADTMFFETSEEASSPDAAPPGRNVDALVAQGYCLSPREDHVPGRYTLRFESDGASSTATAVIAPSGFGPIEVTLSECVDCAATGLVVGRANLGSQPDVVGFPLTVGSERGTAVLRGQQTAFVGSVTTEAGKFLGTLTLERLPPE